MRCAEETVRVTAGAQRRGGYDPIAPNRADDGARADAGRSGRVTRRRITPMQAETLQRVDDDR